MAWLANDTLFQRVIHLWTVNDSFSVPTFRRLRSNPKKPIEAWANREEFANEARIKHEESNNERTTKNSLRTPSELRENNFLNCERTAKKSPEAVTNPWKKQSLNPEPTPRKSKKQSRSELPRFLMKYSCQEYFTMEWLNCQLLIWQTKNLPCWFRTAVLTYTRYCGRKQKGFCLCW